MNVAQLREALEDMPGHWPVHVEIPASVQGVEAGAPRGPNELGDVDLFFTLECVASGFRSHGNMAVIRLNFNPT